MAAPRAGVRLIFFAVSGDAKSADNSIELLIIPQYTWQYIDDPVALRQMQVQNQSDARYGMKPCPVQAPMSAADFLRQDFIAKHRTGKTVVSTDRFPELNGIVRSQLGLPGDGAAGGPSGMRQLDANDKLFKLIASTIQPEPVWQKSSNGMIAALYVRKQQELAKQSAAIAQFQLHVA
jgi:hypothetical protein